MTIFLTTQYLEEADKLADEVAIIDRGRIVAQGAPGVLKKAIGNEVVKLSFDSEDTARRAADVLERQGPDRRLAGSDLLCYFTTAAGRLPELVRTLDEAGVGLEGLTVSEPTLDDVFLQATGHRMSPRRRPAASADRRAERGQGRGREANVTDIFLLVSRSLRNSLRVPAALIPNVAISVFFLFVFNSGLSSVANLPGFKGSYLAFIIPVSIVSASVAGRGAPASCSSATSSPDTSPSCCSRAVPGWLSSGAR